MQFVTRLFMERSVCFLCSYCFDEAEGAEEGSEISQNLESGSANKLNQA